MRESARRSELFRMSRGFALLACVLAFTVAAWCEDLSSASDPLPPGEGRRPIVATQMPPVPVIRSLYSEIVRSLNGNIRSTFRFYELETDYRKAQCDGLRTSTRGPRAPCIVTAHPQYQTSSRHPASASLTLRALCCTAANFA
jgi:hypothetical protein